MSTYYALDPQGRIVLACAEAFDQAARNSPEYAGFQWMKTDAAIGQDDGGGLYLTGPGAAQGGGGQYPDSPGAVTPAAPGARNAAQVQREVDRRLRVFAAARGWDGIDRALSQRGEFAGDAALAQSGYDAIWRAFFAVREAVASGRMTAGEAIATLPELSWETAAGE